MCLPKNNLNNALFAGIRIKQRMINKPIIQSNIRHNKGILSSLIVANMPADMMPSIKNVKIIFLLKTNIL